MTQAVLQGDTKEIWKEVLLKLYSNVPQSQFLTWFKNTAILEIEGGTLTLGVPTSISFNNIADKFLALIQKASAEVLEKEVCQVQLRVDGSLHKKDMRVVDIVRLARTAAKKNEQRKEELMTPTAVPSQNKRSPMVDGSMEETASQIVSSKSKYTLSNFIVGPENQLAYAACCAVSKAPGESYNPLFIYGGVGLGKTHLMQATGHEIKMRFPRKKILYVSSEQFTNELIQAIGNHKTPELRRKYREIDVLMIDDIQFLANKQQTQMEFFHTFNELHQDKKQIIISSDRPPKELDTLEQRLTSRFEWGMIVDVQFPDVETRSAILRMKCKERGIFLSEEVIDFIAHNVHSSIRELEGVLNQAVALYELSQTTPTIKTIGPVIMKLNQNRMLQGYTYQNRPQTRASTIEEVMDSTSIFFHVSKDEMLGASRKKEIALARQVVMYIAKYDLGHTYEKIGELLGGRLHSTVMHSCNKIGNMLKKSDDFKRDLNSIRLDLGLM